MSGLSKTDYLLFAIIAVILAGACFVAVTDPDGFSLRYAAEDGLVEYLTAVFLLVSAFVLWGHTRRAALWRPALLLGFYGLLFFFAAGEEISWGQRIFDLQPNEFFMENNKQAEITLHNLVVADVSLASFLFGNVLTVTLLMYLVVLPLMYPRFAWVQAFVRALMVPVPRPAHAAITLGMTAIILWIDLPRQWEVYEAGFSVLALSIFLNPANRALFWGKG